MNKEIQTYIDQLQASEMEICKLLANTINAELAEAESKIWHAHPVWFLDGNPVAGFSKQKKGIRLMFWSGADFEEENLNIVGGKFKDASIFFNNVEEINTSEINRWLQKSREIQWDYKNIVKRKGKLEKIQP
ncbi:MAG: DUF1801 domain-containing protein [Bacteroidia bacterium]|nr:DUF1801 domain-containing protein [Bacteroidia bacterium]